MKIKSIKIENFKAIEELEIDFNGCSAIVTGANNSGKTSFLKGIVDRIRFIRPDVMVKKGAKEGKGRLVLDNGEKFDWEFSDSGKDKLTYTTEKGIKQNVTKEIGSVFFPPVFDIDKFLQSSPKKQSEQLQAIVGLDFTEIDQRYQDAYNIRTERNRDAERFHVKLSAMLKVPKVDPVDLTELQAKKDAERARLNELYRSNKATNDKARAAWTLEKEAIDKDVKAFNDIQVARVLTLNACEGALSILKKNGYKGTEVKAFVKSIDDSIEAEKTAFDLYPDEPEYIPEMPSDEVLIEIDSLIMDASTTNEKARQYKEYIDYQAKTDAAQNAARLADELVKSIEDERLRMIESVKMPEGITITPAGIEVDGLPLDRNQISTSKLYCAALRIASMGLGEVRTLYFDISACDRKTVEEINDWAVRNDLQLLLERPSFEGGEIKYELIEG